MMRRLLFPVFLLLTFLTASAQKTDAVLSYITNYRAIAIEEMQRSGVPAAIKLAQGILESMAGQSELVQKSNNHFGIKCKTDYNGPYVLHDDDAPQERFMKYEKAEISYKDHSDFLKSRDRYAFLFTLDPTDYKAWAYGLKKAGYATNPKYPQLLIGLIERYNLEDYTLIAMGKKEMPAAVKEYLAANNEQEEAPLKVAKQYPSGDFTINETRVIFVKKGTPYESIAAKYKIPVLRLLVYNDLVENQTITAKDGLIYLQLKRTIGSNPYHEVAPGETIHDVAQAEGVRMDALMRYNNLTKFASPAIGSKLYLQEVNPVQASVAQY